MATYTFNLSGSKEFPSVDIPAGTATTFSIVNPSSNDSYFTLESERNSKGYYDENSPKNTSGSFTVDSNVLNQIQSDYITSFIVKPGTSEILFEPASYISGSSLNIRGVGGRSKQPQFVSTWKTDNAGGADQIALPLISGQPYDMTINWGDGTSTYVSSSTQGELIHVYPNSGSYTVYITGLFSGTRAGSERNDLINISNWGNFNITNGSDLFSSYTNLTVTAPDSPQISTTTLNRAFRYAHKFNGYINDWDVSNVTDFFFIFGSDYVFNQPLNKWNITSAADVRYMFANFPPLSPAGGIFNQPLESWDIGNSNITSLFLFMYNQPKFNQPLNSWDVSKVTEFNGVLAACDSFNQPLDNWDMSSATSIGAMFANYAFADGYKDRYGSFNQDVGSWDVSNVTAMNQVFQMQIRFDNGGSDSIKNWNTSKVTDFRNMFISTPFNQDISSWNVSSGSSFEGMFSQAPYDLDKGLIITKFNQNLGSWDMGNAVTMSLMFDGNQFFDNGGSDSIRNWNTSNVNLMNGIFRKASSFNQPLDGWDTSNVTDFSSSFEGATSFDQDLSSWNVASASTMQEMFKDVTLSTANYDALLVSWASQSLSSSVVFDGGNSKYTGTPGSEPSASRAKMINVYNWTITDGGAA